MNFRFFVISFSVHILMAGLTLINFQVIKEKKPEVVVIEIKEVVKKEIKAIDKPAGNKLGKKGSLLLFPRSDSMDILAQVEKNTEWARTAPRDQKAFNDSRTFDSNIDEVFGENGNQNWSYYKEIYKRIDSNLMFDSILAQYSHFGRVYVEFKVNDEGLFSLEDLKTDSSDAILKVHVLRAIKKSLNKPMATVNKSKFLNITVFKAEFDFSYGDFENNFYKQNNFGKPVFVFKRTTTEKPVPKELLEHLLSGGVTPNVSLMYERWQKYNKKKHLEAIDFDPFENYKRDAFYLM